MDYHSIDNFSDKQQQKGNVLSNKIKCNFPLSNGRSYSESSELFQSKFEMIWVTNKEINLVARTEFGNISVIKRNVLTGFVNIVSVTLLVESI